MKKLLYAYLLVTCVYLNNASALLIGPAANTAVETKYTHVVLGSMWEQLGHPKATVLPPPEIDITPKPSPAPKKKNAPKKLKRKIVVKPTPEPTPIPTPIVKKKELTAGQKKIQALLAKNRAKLKNREQNLKREEKLQKRADNKAERNGDYMSRLKSKSQRGLDKLKRKNNAKLDYWKNLRQKTFARWKKQRAEFLTKLSDYQENLYDIESFESATVQKIPAKKLRTPLTGAVKGKYHLIPGALDVPTRDQGRRPTCASFAAIRAVETLLMGSGKEVNLSEQYFYWASKPKCQSSPCSRRGSWVTNGFERSLSSNSPDIPTEKSCPYKSNDNSSNQTYVPMSSSCNKGKVKIGGYDRIETINQMKNALDNNLPIIAGLKLSPNFYKNEGFIGYRDSFKSGSKDSHASGHAVLLVGYMALPKKQLVHEGKICFIIANSWGPGWGRGGFACASEKWVRHYRIKNAFIALNSAKIE